MPESLTGKLKQELWRRFGTEDYPAEWDGIVYGGGKLSQRFWEYFKAIELLDLTPDSVVLDIGGGSPTTGLGFFMSILAPHVKRVIIMDPQIKNVSNDDPRVTLIPEFATRDTLPGVLQANPDITHISSVSVMEHVEPDIRTGIFEAINGHFQGGTVVLTLEYHTTHVFFEVQLTAASLTPMVKPLTRFYLDAFEASPVHCENAVEAMHTLIARKRKWLSPHLRFLNLFLPKWYPLALRFRQAQP